MRTKVLIILFICLFITDAFATSCTIYSQPTGYVSKKNGDYTFRVDEVKGQNNGMGIATIENINSGEKNSFPFSTVTPVMHLYNNGDFLTTGENMRKYKGILIFDKKGELVKNITIDKILNKKRHVAHACAWFKIIKFRETVSPVEGFIDLTLLNHDKAYVDLKTSAVEYEFTSFDKLRDSPDKMFNFVGSIKNTLKTKPKIIKLYREILNLYPKHYPTVEKLGYLLPNSEAILLLEDYLKDTPLLTLEIDKTHKLLHVGSGEHSYQKLAKLYIKGKQVLRAMEIYEGLYKAGSRNGTILTAYAKILVKQEQQEKALELLSDVAMAETSQRFSIVPFYAKQLFSIGKNDKAKQVIQKFWSKELANLSAKDGDYYPYSTDEYLSRFMGILNKNEERDLARKIYIDLEREENEKRLKLKDSLSIARLDNLLKNGFHKEAIKRYKRLAKSRGDNLVEYKLAKLYYSGKSIEKDFSESYKWYQKALEKKPSNAQAFIELNVCLFKILEKKYSEAFKLCKSSSSKNGYNKTIKLWLALLYLDKNHKHYDKNKANTLLDGLLKESYSIKWGDTQGEDYFKSNYSWAEDVLTKQAELNNANAQYLLAFLLQKTKTLEPEDDVARKWYEKSAKGGVSESMIALGMSTFLKGDEKNQEKWFGMAIEHGNLQGHYWLAHRYISNAEKLKEDGKKYIFKAKYHVEQYNKKSNEKHSVRYSNFLYAEAMTQSLSRRIEELEEQHESKIKPSVE